MSTSEQPLKYDIVYGTQGRITMPEVQVKPNAGYTYEALRGYGYVLAAFEGKTCVGWVHSWDLGFDSASAWMAAQGKS